MYSHSALRSLAVAVGKGCEQHLMLIQRLLGDTGMEHQAKDVEVGVLMRERPADQIVTSELENAVVENSVLPGEGRIAHAFVASLPARHNPRGFLEHRQAPWVDSASASLRSFGFQQKTEFIKFIETTARYPWCSAVADKMSLCDQPLTFKPAQSLPDGSLRHVQLTG